MISCSQIIDAIQSYLEGERLSAAACGQLKAQKGILDWEVSRQSRSVDCCYRKDEISPAYTGRMRYLPYIQEG